MPKLDDTLYTESAYFAIQMGMEDLWRENHEKNTDCALYIAQNNPAHNPAHNGQSMKEFAEEVSEKFGANRVSFVLAQTITERVHDGDEGTGLSAQNISAAAKLAAPLGEQMVVPAIVSNADISKLFDECSHIAYEEVIKTLKPSQTRENTLSNSDKAPEQAPQKSNSDKAPEQAPQKSNSDKAPESRASQGEKDGGKLSNAEKIKALTEKLDDTLQNTCADAESYKTCLKTMAKFPNGDVRNTVLIAAQNPDATYVMDFNAWKQKLDRSVKRGEKGIEVFMPASFKKKLPSGKEMTVPYFRPAHVFDVSQTYGDRQPKRYNIVLDGSVKDYGRFMKALEATAPEAAQSASKPNLRLRVQEAVNNAVQARYDAADKAPDTARLEKAAAAYVVCRHFGIDVSDNGIKNAAKVFEGKTVDEMKNSIAAVQTAASSLIKELNKELRKEQTRETQQENPQQQQRQQQQQQQQAQQAQQQRQQQRQQERQQEQQQRQERGYELSKAVASTLAASATMYMVFSPKPGREKSEHLKDYSLKAAMDVNLDGLKKSELLCENGMLDGIRKGHSLNENDVVAFVRRGNTAAYRADDNFTALPQFAEDVKNDLTWDNDKEIEAEKRTRATMPTAPPKPAADKARQPQDKGGQKTSVRNKLQTNKQKAAEQNAQRKQKSSEHEPDGR